MWNAIVAEDDTGQILSAWIAKEELRTLLSTVRAGGDAAPDPPPAAPVPGLVHRLPNPRATHPGHHHRHLVARNQRLRATGITNARTEGYNRLVKTGQTRRDAGSETRANSARRIRFHCTRKQRAATQTSC